MTKSISNTDKVIDSRDVIARIEELQDMKFDAEIARDEELQEAKEAREEEIADGAFNSENLKDIDSIPVEEDDDVFYDGTPNLTEWGFDENDYEELAMLQELAGEASGYATDWKYGETLIHEDYFVDYCRQLVQDIGDLPKDLPSYIENNIDWDGVADDLKMDYTSVNFGGETYYVRG